MNRALPILSLCVAVLALASSFVPRGSDVPAPAVSTEAPRAGEDEAELRRRVAQLEDEQRLLWDRLGDLQRRPAAVLTDGGAPSPALTAEVERLRDEVRSVMTGEVLSTEAGREALKEVIREAEVDRMRERQAQQLQRQQARALEQKLKWKDFVSEAKLTFPQEQELTRRLDAEEGTRKAALEAVQAGTTPPREAFRTVRDQQRETDQAMAAILDEAQKKQFDALRSEERAGARPGGGRGPRGGE